MKLFSTIAFAQLVVICIGEPGRAKRCCQNGFMDTDSKTCHSPNSTNFTSAPIPGSDYNQDFDITGADIPSCKEGFEPRLLINSIDGAPEFTLIQNDSQLLDLENLSRTIEFCIDHTEDNDKAIAMYCRPTRDCTANKCLRFCCHPGEIRKNSTCIDSGDNLELFNDSDVRYLFGIPRHCTHVGESRTKFNYSTKLDEVVQNLHEDEYCLATNYDGTLSLVYCLFEEESYDSNFLKGVLTMALLTSLFFLVLSWLYVWRHSKEKLFGALTLNMIAMLFLYFLALLISSYVELSENLCKGFAYLLQFAYLSAIWWLNSLCFDIWQTFRSIKASVKTHSGKTYGWRHPKFKSYASWSFGMPGLITLVTFCIEKFCNHYEGTLLHPGIGRDGSCNLSKEGLLLYIIAPSLLVLVSNVVFFSITTWKLCCGLWADDQSSRLKNMLERANSTTKIFAAAGIAWIAEAVSWLILYLNHEHEETILKVSFALDLINALQGLTLFLAITLDKATCNWLKKKITSFCGSRARGEDASESSTMSLKEFWNSISGRSVRVYSLDQPASTKPEANSSEEKNSVSYRRNSFEEC